MSARQIHLAGFLIAGNTAHSHAIWRHPASEPDFLSAGYYQEIARSLERGLFDLVFFADRLAMSATYGGSIETGARYGDQDATRLDPIPVLAAMSAVTSRIGLGATRSTTYAQPYSLARSFATLDHLSAGRAAWNVVTSVNQGEADNFGLTRHLDHDQRYDAADEFLELTFALWDSWQPGALLLDREAGLYADPDRIQRVEHEGRFFRCRGPLNIPRSPQGRPVIIQAGSSARGQDFAARWAEIVFSIQPDLPRMRRFYTDLKERAVRQGREPAAVKVLTAVMPFVAASRAEAEAARDAHNALIHPEVGLSTLSSHMNFDFSRLPLDAPVAELAGRGHAGPVCRRAPAQRRGPDAGRCRPALRRERHGAPARGHARGDRGSAPGAVRGRSVRRLRGHAGASAARLRRLRRSGGAGAAGARPVPRALSRHDPARAARRLSR